MAGRTPLIDYFVVCGLNYDTIPLAGRSSALGDSSLQPQVLVHYPEVGTEAPFDETAVLTLCMPNGLTFEKNISKVEETIEFHTFMITREDGSNAYGGVVTFLEQIVDKESTLSICTLLQTKKGPFLFDSEEDTLFISKSLCLVSTFQVVQPLQSFLTQMAKVVIMKDTSDIPLEGFIFKLLFEVRMPSPGQQVNFWGPLSLISWVNPPKDILPLVDYSIAELIQIIGLPNLLKLITAVSLEHQILLTSSSYYHLMLCAQTVIALMYPFQWQQVFVPILPSSQLGFLDAPVPFLMGLKLDPQSDRQEIADIPSLCQFDIDSGVFSFTDELPALPEESALISDMRKVIEEYSVSCKDLEKVTASESKPSSGSLREAIKFVSSQLTQTSGLPVNSTHDMDNPHVHKLMDIMSRLPQVDEVRLDIQGNGQQSIEPYFSSEFRMIFFKYFASLFRDYEDFVIIPQQSYEQWDRDRDQFQNFDKMSFLSDQSEEAIPFFSAFIETQMFSQFVDQKILHLWQITEGQENVASFDDCIKAEQENTPYQALYKSTPVTPDIDSPSLKPPLQVEKPSQAVGRTLSWPKGQFPLFNDDSLLKRAPQLTPMKTGPRKQKREKRQRPPNSSLTFSASSHSQFVLHLWRETRMRVKHMLSSAGDSQSRFEEENTMIAKLCDLLERIWGHGLTSKNESRSPLWFFLTTFADRAQRQDGIDIKLSVTTSESPGLSPLPEKRPVSSTPKTEVVKAHFNRQRLQSPKNLSRIESLSKPVATSLDSFFEDLQVINGMPEIKTDVGRARAWVRLALEKKVLSSHLKTLLSNQELCEKKFLRHAFLRTLEEKDQSLTFLLTLSARDFSCFTSAFRNVIMNYRVLVLAEGKHLGFTSSSLYVNVGGEYRMSSKRVFPKGENQIEFQSQNLGHLTCIRLGHDNSGAIRSMYVESVLVKNLTTGKTYKFPCKRWLSRSEDDNATERFLIGETVEADAMGKIVNETSLFPRSSNLKKKKSNSLKGISLTLSEIRSNLSAASQRLVSVSSESTVKKRTLSSRRTLTSFLDPDTGFLQALTKTLQLGFISPRKCTHLWDLIDQVEIKYSADNGTTTSAHARSFSSAVCQLRTHGSNLGKDELFLLFVALGIRECQLRGWIEAIAASPIIDVYYEPTSFLRDQELSDFLFTTLQSVTEVSVLLGDILLHGL